jgi:branched-chain amino acid aminotransferase
LFETIKVWKGKILLEQLHFERLFSGLSILNFAIPKLFSSEKISDLILQLCKKNNCDELGRVRLSVFRGNGGLYDSDSSLQYIIECWPLNESINRLNENGLVIDIFPDAKKSVDHFSNLKSSNFLPYSMAALFAKQNKLNDCLVLNANGNIADSTIANIFIIKNGILKTPALTEGCIRGVIRRHLITCLSGTAQQIHETIINEDELLQADEVFLTNAINGIRWVKQFRDKVFTNNLTKEIYNRFFKTIQA